MNTELLEELEDCMMLCKKLEQLLQLELDELYLSVTGEIYDEYATSVGDLVQSVTEMRQKIMLLYSCL